MPHMRMNSKISRAANSPHRTPEKSSSTSSVLGFWFMLCLRVYTRHFVRHVSWPLFFGLLVAVTDETIQLYVPGRTSSTLDVLLDFSGVVSGLFVALVILLFFRMCGILWRNREREIE